MEYDSKRARSNRAQVHRLVAHWLDQPNPVVQLRGQLRFGPARRAAALGVTRQFLHAIETRRKVLPSRLLLDILDNWRPEVEAAGLCVEQFLRACRPPDDPPPEVEG